MTLLKRGLKNLLVDPGDSQNLTHKIKILSNKIFFFNSEKLFERVHFYDKISFAGF